MYKTARILNNITHQDTAEKSTAWRNIWMIILSIHLQYFPRGTEYDSQERNEKLAAV